ncbi:hypothetical protein HDU97_010452 [Phlyctochytrium planicorne]|nr:hypothetical protein HDU97_010452 [Phlyctochytrium planicorne]
MPPHLSKYAKGTILNKYGLHAETSGTICVDLNIAHQLKTTNTDYQSSKDHNLESASEAIPIIGADALARARARLRQLKQKEE